MTQQPSNYTLFPRLIKDKLRTAALIWWKTGDRKPLYWLSWDKISAYKSEGGLGIRDFCLLNQALLANQCWRLLNNPSLLISQSIAPEPAFSKLNTTPPHPGRGKASCLVGPNQQSFILVGREW